MSSVLTAFGQITQGIAADKAGQFNANVLNNNATFSQQQGAENQRRIKRSNAQLEGSNIANLGASGIRLSGSALNVLSDSAIEGTLASLDAKVSAENKAKGLRTQATVERTKGKNARRAGYISAGATVLGSYEKAAAAGGK